MTQEEREYLSAAQQRLRNVALTVGPLHAYWDVIMDIGDALRGEAPSIGSVQRLLAHVKELDK